MPLDPDSSDRAPDLAEVLRRAIDAKLADVHTMIPAMVVRYDSSTQQVDCKILVKASYLDESDIRQIESLPVVPGVPVSFPGGGGFRLTFPLSDGNLLVDGTTVKATTGMLIFSERSLDRWLSGNGAEVDPEIDHEHALFDAVFVPGLNPFGAPLASAPTDHATLGSDSGVQIHLHNTVVALGDESGNDYVALASKVDAAFTALQGVFSVPSNFSNIAALGAALSTLLAPPINWPMSTAATQVKAK